MSGERAGPVPHPRAPHRVRDWSGSADSVRDGIPAAQASPTPAGPFVGAGTCFYWLHTHAADGIIHIESPTERTYTLGNFFDVWGQKLGPGEVGPVTGRVTAFYDGRWFRGNPRDIPLSKHAQIQLDVGQPLVAPVGISFPDGL